MCLGSRATTQGPQDTAAGGGASLRRPRASLRVLAAKERVSARPVPHIAQALCGPQPTSASRPSRRRASGEAATSTGLSSGAGCAREKHAPDTGRGVVRGPSSTGSARSTRLSKLWGRGGGVQAEHGGAAQAPRCAACEWRRVRRAHRSSSSVCSAPCSVGAVMMFAAAACGQRGPL